MKIAKSETIESKFKTQGDTNVDERFRFLFLHYLGRFFFLILPISAYKNVLVLYKSSCTTVYASMEVKLEFLIW